mgnify:CR=1 FL=1
MRFTLHGSLFVHVYYFWGGSDARPFFRLCLHTALSVCHMGVRKWLEKSAEKQKQKLRKTLNPLSRKAFQAVSFSATKDNKKDIRKDVLFVLSAEPFCRETSNGESGKYREKVQSRSCTAQWTAGVTDQRCLVMLLSYSY